ncbi:hypothetical protein NECAME_01161 [Necator americanus]|uniref:Uncharacterized protein n=1 Tax=Necator americanus TaxID=51031 RepID=W2SJI4_NECAM|nr:hypothetical protein NECAME_01161 [Necator americanus]ETN69051.1 hypothetical protein NECAME_01161 [Necator americanus]
MYPQAVAAMNICEAFSWYPGQKSVPISRTFIIWQSPTVTLITCTSETENGLNFGLLLRNIKYGSVFTIAAEVWYVNYPRCKKNV